jgi:L-arabinokinase
MSGAEFLGRYRGITDAVTSVDPARWYHVRQSASHPVHEHARVTRFAEVLKGWRGEDDSRELGALMYQSHKSYSACCLGSPGTDELVRIVREAGEGSGLYGAKITGGGSGGTVAILGRRDARAAVEAVAAEYARRTEHEPLVIAGSSQGAGAFGFLKLRREEG